MADYKKFEPKKEFSESPLHQYRKSYSVKLIPDDKDISPYNGNYMVFHINVRDEKLFDKLKELGTNITNLFTPEGKPPDNIDDLKILSDFTPTNQYGRHRTRLNSFTHRTEASILLPVPISLKFGNKIDYDTKDLGLTGSIVSEMKTTTGLGAAEITKGIGGIIAEKLSDALTKSAGKAVDIVTGGILNAETLAKEAQQQIDKIPGIVGGYAINPYKEVVLQAVNFRDFTLTWDFLPKDKTESENLNTIINMFKYHMHPSIDSAAARFLNYPSEFDIELYHKNEENSYLDFYSTCVITNMEVDYNGKGEFLTHSEGQPQAVSLTLSLQETEIIDRKSTRLNSSH